jgi:hypothetical protein
MPLLVTLVELVEMVLQLLLAVHLLLTQVVAVVVEQALLEQQVAQVAVVLEVMMVLAD